MKEFLRLALFCSTLLGMGVLFGICIAFFARKYAKEQVKASRANRATFKTKPDNELSFVEDWGKK